MVQFKPDFNRDLVPTSFLYKASEWYINNLTWWKFFQIGTGIYLTFVLIFLSVSALVYDFWIDEEFPIIHSIFFECLPLLLMLIFVFCLSIFPGYFQSKKKVLVKYIKNEISEMELILKSISIEEHNVRLWESFELKEKRNLLVNHFSSLDLKKQEDYQDQFLDILNEADIKYQDIPEVLQPILPVEFVTQKLEIHYIQLNRIFALKRILKSISN